MDPVDSRFCIQPYLLRSPMILNCSNPGCKTLFMPSFGICPTCGSPGEIREISPAKFSADEPTAILSRFDVETAAATFLATLVWVTTITSDLNRTEVDDNPFAGALYFWLALFVGIPCSVICANIVAPLAVRLSSRYGRFFAILMSMLGLALSLAVTWCGLYFATLLLRSPLLYIMTTLGIWISVPVLFGSLYHMVRLMTYSQEKTSESQKSQPEVNFVAEPEPVIMFCTVCNKDRCFDEDDRCVECNWFV